MLPLLLAVNWLMVGGLLFALLILIGLGFLLIRSISTTETGMQSVVYEMEEGSWVSRIRLVLLLAAMVTLFCVFIFDFELPAIKSPFRGLSHAKAMDQAQVAREIARGNGFSTQLIRPIALKQFEINKGLFPTGNLPDTYNAPLNPFILALPLWLVKNTWPMTVKNYVYTSDRVIAALGLIFFFLSVGVNFCTAKRLFDRRLALLGMGLILLADEFWQFSLSGLPQMLMLLIFSGCTYSLVRALEARQEERNPLLWIALTGALFGLLALTHGLTVWIFAGALIYVALLFRPIGRAALLMLFVFTLVYSPWMVRNYNVCGSLFGVAPYSGLSQIRGTETSIMRSMVVNFSDVNPTTFRNKIQSQWIGQTGNLFNYLGKSLVAPVFFLSLLHLFRMPVPGVFRWGILLMWFMAVFGMCVFGLSTDPGELQSNDLHVLFIPLMIFYGLAMVLVLWTRLEIRVKLLHVAFLSIIYLFSAFPLINSLISSSKGRFQWPPYIPPVIAMINTWTNSKEIIASDMPWAVAWYADRKSIWLPSSIVDFLTLDDYNLLGGRIVGLHLTPVTGNQAFVAEIINGEYKEWAPFIMRNFNVLRDFPLKESTRLPGDSIFYGDRDRWTQKVD